MLSEIGYAAHWGKLGGRRRYEIGEGGRCAPSETRVGGAARSTQQAVTQPIGRLWSLPLSLALALLAPLALAAPGRPKPPPPMSMLTS